jgi:type IV pilus assembly protein PilW
MKTNAVQRSKFKRMAGLSLVELMIAMTLGLATIGTVGWVYLGASQTFRTQDSIARLQEGARYAFEVISNDLRMTGAAGCSFSTSTNVISNYSTVWYANLFDQPLLSTEEDGTSGSTTEFSDALRIIRADVTREYIVDTHDAPSAAINVGSYTGINVGDPLLITNCNHAAVFAASSATSPVIGHAAGAGGNSTSDLGNGGPLTYLSTMGSRIYPLQAATYYVDTNPAGVPSVEGVEDLQVSFGVDTDTPLDGEIDLISANPYINGSVVSTSAALGATPEDRWQRVVSVRVSLSIRVIGD